MIEVKNLTKKYGAKLAVDDISFLISKGEIVGLLGKNGAGKTTIMNILTGYLSPSKGSVKIDDHDILEEPLKSKKNIGYLPENPPLYLDMTVRSYLEFIFDLKKSPITKKEHIKSICERVKIDDVYERIIKNLSKGYKQRVGLAGALLGEPPILILDEPTVGLDPQQIIEIRNLIKSLNKKHTVIFSSHVLSEVQSICDRIIVIDNGKIIADDTTENLVNNFAKIYKYQVTIEGNRELVHNLLTKIEGVKKVTYKEGTEDGIYDYILESDSDIRRVLATEIKKAGFIMLGLKKYDTNLEEIFIKLTQNKEDTSNTQDEAPDTDQRQNEEETAEVEDGHKTDQHQNEGEKPIEAEDIHEMNGGEEK